LRTLRQPHRECRQYLVIPVRPTLLDADISALDLRRLLCLSRFHVDNSIRACERVACIAGPALALRPFWKAQAVIAGDHKTLEQE